MKKFLVILAALAFIAGGPVGSRGAETVRLPESPIGRRIAGFLDVLKSRDDDKARGFIGQNYTEMALKNRSMEDRLNAYHDLYEEVGASEIRSVTQKRRGETAVVVESAASGEWTRFRFDHEPDGEERIVGIMISPAPPVTVEIPAGKLSDDAMSRHLNEFMGALAAKDRFSGTVLVARDGKPIFTGAYGLANKSFNVPNALDTKFNLGSMNKMFTAMAIAQLVEAGKLAFDDPVGKHLPDFPTEAVKNQVTIHHLLTHTSGLGSYFESPIYEETWTRLRKVADYVPIVSSDQPAFTPGERMRYSNTGFVLLGLIIEKVSGEDYYDYVRKHIFEPAGMTNTDSYEVDAIVPNLAIGYTSNSPHGGRFGTPRANLLAHSIKGTPAGGGFSTVEDFLKFDQALRTHKLLGKEHTDILLEGKVPMGPEMRYAYGFGDDRRGGNRAVGHNGGAPGISADFKCYLDSGFTTVVLSNYDQAAGMVAEHVGELVARQMLP